jgi:hypothetical protein
MEYSIIATEEQIELLGSVACSVCLDHVMYRLPDGSHTDIVGVKAWFLERGIDLESSDFMWAHDFMDGYDHCIEDEDGGEPDNDHSPEDFNKILAEMFEDDNN